MPSVFTKIIAGELPGRFVYRDPRAVAFLTIAPIKTGHTLVVPVNEVDHWIDLPEGDWAHLQEVARKVGAAIAAAFRPVKVAQVVAGLEVPHTHVHLIPFDHMGELDFARAEQNPDPAGMDAAASQIVSALREAGVDPGI